MTYSLIWSILIISHSPSDKLKALRLTLQSYKKTYLVQILEPCTDLKTVGVCSLIDQLPTTLHTTRFTLLYLFLVLIL